MDGTLPAGLPAIPTAPPGYAGAPAAVGGAMPMRQPIGNPVGRPAADPEVQEARVARSHEKKRLESVLPKKATDSKLLIYRTKGGRMTPGTKPVLTILTSEIEKVVGEAAGDPEASEDFIAQKLAEKGHENGLFICKTVDRLGRTIDGIAPFEIEMGDAVSDDDVVDDEEEEIDDGPGFRGAPFAYPGAPPAYAAPMPPAPQPMDMQGMAAAMRNERQDEAKRQNESMSMIVMLLQSQQQQAQQLQAAQQQRDEQYRREQADREERHRREEKEREEREQARRGEFRQTLLAAAPLLLPLVEKVLGLNKKEGPDPMTLMLMEMVKQKSPDSDILRQMAGVMGEMTKQQMQLQGSGAQAAVEMQAKASSVVFENMMKTMKEALAGRPAGGEEEGTLAQIAKIAGPLLANMQQGQQPNPQQAPPPMAIEAPVAAQATQPAPVEAPARPQKRAAPRPQRRNDPNAYSDNDRIALCIDTLRKLSLGEIPADQRWGVVRFIAQWMPPTVLQAVVEGRKDDLLAATIPVVAMHPQLMSWAQAEENQTFVEDAMTDLKALMLRQVTPEHEASAIRATRTFVERHAQAAAATAAAPAPQAAPPATPAAEVNPEAANDAPPATPVEGAKPIPFPNAEGRRRRATKRAPPAAPTGDAPPATPVDDNGAGEPT